MKAGKCREASMDDVCGMRRTERGIGQDSSAALGVQQLKLFVGTWNVAGRAPTMETRKSVQEWLQRPQYQPAQICCSSQPPTDPDIYVLGFQEIVPLNASNVLRGEKEGDTKLKAGRGGLLAREMWEALIDETLNNQNLITQRTTCLFSTKTATTRNSDVNVLSDCEHLPHRNLRDGAPAPFHLMPSSGVSACAKHKISGVQGIIPNAPLYARVASRQMVGLFITVWARWNLCPYIRNVQASSVGCGLMNRLGNKGSVSISLSVHETSLCFICGHLRSGESSYDMTRRNDDLQSILNRTRFSWLDKPSPISHLQLPSSILAHDRIILLGDLNCRLNIAPTKLMQLLHQKDWSTLLENDELKIAKGVGGVLQGWHEGSIYFAPTYKYLLNSDTYWLAKDSQASKGRAPAWCDRILWQGKGFKQLSYTRCESKHSDHRPVRSLFMVDIEVLEKKLVVDDSCIGNQRLVTSFLKEIQELCTKKFIFKTFRIHAFGKD